MSAPYATAAEAAAVVHCLKQNADDLMYVEFAERVSDSVRRGGPARCSTVLARLYGSAVQLLPNGFLLGGTDIVELQDAAAGHASDDCVEGRAMEYEYRAIQLARESSAGDTPLHAAIRACKTAYWLTRAAALRDALRLGAPVSRADLEVRPSLHLSRGAYSTTPLVHSCLKS